MAITVGGPYGDGSWCGVFIVNVNECNDSTDDGSPAMTRGG